MLANRGELRPLRRTMDEPVEPGVPLLSPEASWLTLDMLKDASRPDAVNRAAIGDTRPARSRGKRARRFPIAMLGAPASSTTTCSSSGSEISTARRIPNSSDARRPRRLLFRIVDALRAREPRLGGHLLHPDART